MRVAEPLSRRLFLRSLVRATLLFSVGDGLLGATRARAELFSPASAVKPVSSFLRHYVMLVFTDRCTNCGQCVKSCRQANNLSDQGQRITILNTKTGRREAEPFDATAFLPLLCNQCSDPPCVRVCPTKASSQDGDSGLVSIDRRLCIGCRACMVVCPYMARYYDYAAKAVDGCDFCVQSRLQHGRPPACVEACPHQVLYHGDLRNAADPVVALVTENEGGLWLLRSEKGCRPNVLYVSTAKEKEG